MRRRSPSHDPPSACPARHSAGVRLVPAQALELLSLIMLLAALPLFAVAGGAVQAATAGPAAAPGGALSPASRGRGVEATPSTVVALHRRLAALPRLEVAAEIRARLRAAAGSLHTACTKHGRGCPTAYVALLEELLEAALQPDVLVGRSEFSGGHTGRPAAEAATMAASLQNKGGGVPPPASKATAVASSECPRDEKSEAAALEARIKGLREELHHMRVAQQARCRGRLQRLRGAPGMAALRRVRGAAKAFLYFFWVVLMQSPLLPLLLLAAAALAVYAPEQLPIRCAAVLGRSAVAAPFALQLLLGRGEREGEVVRGSGGSGGAPMVHGGDGAGASGVAREGPPSFPTGVGGESSAARIAPPTITEAISTVHAATDGEARRAAAVLLCAFYRCVCRRRAIRMWAEVQRVGISTAALSVAFVLWRACLLVAALPRTPSTAWSLATLVVPAEGLQLAVLFALWTVGGAPLLLLLRHAAAGFAALSEGRRECPRQLSEDADQMDRALQELARLHSSGHSRKA